MVGRVAKVAYRPGLPCEKPDSNMTSRPEPVLLIIADISGYTQFMTANAKTLAHAQAIITELVTAIIREVELPLTVAKLEGDAVFLYAKKEDGVRPWSETRKMIGDRLLRFFTAFSSKLKELRGVTTCDCHSCRSMERLRLKLVVHSGEALFHHVFGTVDLAGVDVIIAHRLLKNSVSSDQYILMTEAAVKDVEFPIIVPFKPGIEDVDDIGEIKTQIYQPYQATAKEPTHSSPTRQPDYGDTVRRSSRWFLRLWFQPFRQESTHNSESFQHVKSRVALPEKALYKAFILIASPLFIPIGLLFVLIRMTGRFWKHGLQSRGETMRRESTTEHSLRM